MRFKSDVARVHHRNPLLQGQRQHRHARRPLWTSTGTLLASATFTGETATGWQQVSFATPVAISANTTYVASYYRPRGPLRARPAVLHERVSTTRRCTPSRTETADPTACTGTATGFPTESYQASNYWVDVVFATSAVDTTPPTVAGVTPASGASNVSLGTGVSATFSEAISAASVTATSFVLRDAGGNAVPASVSASGVTATLQPNATLAPSTSYTATLLAGSSGIKDLAGNALASNYSWSFTTLAADTTPPISAVAFPANSGSYNAARWNTGCSPSGLCGSASDAGSGVQKIEVSILRASTNRYWTGTGYTSTTERWVVASGTTTWSYALASTSFPGAGSYSVRVRATDNAGNVSSPTTTTFVYDNTNPSSTVTFPVAKASYTTTSWNAGCPAPGMCGTASDAVAGVQKVEISIRRGSASYWNGTSFSSASEVFFPTDGYDGVELRLPSLELPGQCELHDQGARNRQRGERSVAEFATDQLRAVVRAGRPGPCATTLLGTGGRRLEPSGRRRRGGRRRPRSRPASRRRSDPERALTAGRVSSLTKIRTRLSAAAESASACELSRSSHRKQPPSAVKRTSGNSRSSAAASMPARSPSAILTGLDRAVNRASNGRTR